MEIKKIKYLNLVNDSLDVFVTLENLVEVATPQFLSSLMEKVESDFVPYIIVSKLTELLYKNLLMQKKIRICII
jgi:hypothetical protein